MKVAFDGSLGSHLVTPRGLNSRLVNKFVGVQGIVTSITRVKPKLLRSFHYCEKTNKPLLREYSDKYNLTDEVHLNQATSIPVYDEEQNPLSLEYGLCEYRDVQTVTIQEMPENVPTGQLSRSMEIVLQEDLVDLTKPGDRIQVNGVLRPLGSSQTNTIGIFRTVVIATSLKKVNTRFNSHFTPKDISKIRRLSEREDVFEILARSFAPSIYGHDLIKKAAILQLFGGVEKNLNTGTRLRGDINLLLIGDPGTAKSQMLRQMMNISPLSFSTTGRGSSGVGLTAAVSLDPETGEKQLEAGAMVLADKGIICIDEFDKMNHLDRVAMHEVMEQQTVTIAKAGIHVSLNARCSVLAAANPIYGEFMVGKPMNVNIGLPDSLLSRFDLIFTVLDRKDTTIDRQVAERVTKNHMFQGPNVFLSLFSSSSTNGIVEEQIVDDTRELPVFEKFHKLTHDDKSKEILTREFLQQYIGYSKLNVQPELTDESNTFLQEKWSELRQ